MTEQDDKREKGGYRFMGREKQREINLETKRETESDRETQG